jgi:hypothetical protein
MRSKLDDILAALKPSPGLPRRWAILCVVPFAVITFSFLSALLDEWNYSARYDTLFLEYKTQEAAEEQRIIAEEEADRQAKESWQKEYDSRYARCMAGNDYGDPETNESVCRSSIESNIGEKFRSAKSESPWLYSPIRRPSAVSYRGIFIDFFTKSLVLGFIAVFPMVALWLWKGSRWNKPEDSGIG